MRYKIIDEIRGITLISMILYHGIWDLVYIFGWDAEWFRSQGAYLWQRSICWMFILLSGFCWSLGRKKWKRGLTVFGAGILISAVTIFVMPKERIVFGILTLLGSCMLLMIPLERVLKKIKPEVGIAGNLILFVVLQNVNNGYVGVHGIFEQKLPNIWYQNYITTYIGFPAADFYSSDYFSIFPWIFLFVVGYYAYRLLEKKEKLEALMNVKTKGWALGKIGQNSLLIYLCHQPVIYGVLMMGNEFLN